MNPADAAFCLNCATPLAASGPFVGQASNNPGGNFAGSANNNDSAGSKAIAALGLAVAAFLCCGPITGVPAAIVGWMELDSIKNGRSPASGRWMAQTGLWLGIGAAIIHVFGYMLFVLMGALSSPGPYGY